MVKYCPGPKGQGPGALCTRELKLLFDFYCNDADLRRADVLEPVWSKRRCPDGSARQREWRISTIEGDGSVLVAANEIAYAENVERGRPEMGMQRGGLAGCRVRERYRSRRRACGFRALRSAHRVLKARIRSAAVTPVLKWVTSRKCRNHVRTCGLTSPRRPYGPEAGRGRTWDSQIPHVEREEYRRKRRFQ